MKDGEFRTLESALEEEEEKKREESEEVERQAEEERQEQREIFATRVKERNDKIAQYQSSLAKAHAEDSSLKAMVPGYKFKWDALNKEYVEFLLSELKAEEEENSCA